MFDEKMFKNNIILKRYQKTKFPGGRLIKDCFQESVAKTEQCFPEKSIYWKRLDRTGVLFSWKRSYREKNNYMTGVRKNDGNVSHISKCMT